jgi:anti-sigma regulatory factor (Ser/Thr protein kinase)
MHEQRVRDGSDTYGARHAVKSLGQQIGFSRRACDELAIVVSELCSNILKYGVHGSIRMEALNDQRGMMIVARDFGPPFHDLSLALKDGFDDRGPIDPMHMMKRGGIGGGLGAVVRFSHSFRVESLPNGKAIEVVRYLDRSLPGAFGSKAV